MPKENKWAQTLEIYKNKSGRQYGGTILSKTYCRQDMNLPSNRSNKSERKLYKMTNIGPKVPKLNLKVIKEKEPDYKSDRIYHNNRFIDSETFMEEIKGE